MKMTQANRLQAGMTLIELMVAMALGAFLILGVVNVFLANKDSSQIETSLARLQENGRIALDLLVSDLRDAYYVGCISHKSPDTLSQNIMAQNVTWVPFAGYERTAQGFQPALPTALSTEFGGPATTAGNARLGSDIVYVSHGRRILTATDADVGSAASSIPIASNPECISQGETVIIASCSAAKLFRVTNSPKCDGTPTSLAFDLTGNVTDTLGTDFPEGTELMQTFEKTWYVADTGRRRTPNNIPVYALYRLTNGQPLEMVEGVEYMQILYGEDLGLGQLRYVPANNGSLDLSGENIISVRVALLMQSFEQVLDAPDTREYQVADQTIGSADTAFTHNGDRTLRRVFQTTVLLKN